MMISPEQSRAARGWLDWTQTELATRANVSLSTIRDFERGSRTPIRNNHEKIQQAFEDVGISFVFSQGKAAGLVIALDWPTDK
jgi:transcriptional regulator with XRE-family HTH domain